MRRNITWGALKSQIVFLLEQLDWDDEDNSESALKHDLTTAISALCWRMNALLQQPEVFEKYLGAVFLSNYATFPIVEFDWVNGFKIDGSSVEQSREVTPSVASTALKKLFGEDWAMKVRKELDKFDGFRKRFNEQQEAAEGPTLPPKPHTIKRTKTR